MVYGVTPPLPEQPRQFFGRPFQVMALHGFAGADDYYARSSAGPLLGTIRLPTLLLHALNDPFLPAAALPRREQLPPSLTLELTEHGGHVGFVHGAPPGRLDWMPRRVLAHFAQHLPAAVHMR